MNHTQKNKKQTAKIETLGGIPISLSKLRSMDTLELLRFIYYADPNAFIKAFDTIDISINKANPEGELKTLAQWHDTGRDMSGELKSTDGKSLRVDFVRFVEGIQLKHNSVNNSNIKLTV